MQFDLTLDEGVYLVKLARRSIMAEFDNSNVSIDDASEKSNKLCGVFVTLNRMRVESKELRGCIGYPFPIKPLVEAVRDVAKLAAFEDPRFPRVVKDEMNDIVIEVSVLTPPEPVKVEDSKEYPERVKVGVDGLIVKRGYRSGLLLPQVATEWGWDSEELLFQCCLKAGLQPDAWLLKDTEVSKFQAIIFGEKTPNGEVIREETSVC